jgi:hypothetical protein
MQIGRSSILLASDGRFFLWVENPGALYAFTAQKALLWQLSAPIHTYPAFDDKTNRLFVSTNAGLIYLNATTGQVGAKIKDVLASSPVTLMRRPEDGHQLVLISDYHRIWILSTDLGLLGQLSWGSDKGWRGPLAADSESGRLCYFRDNDAQTFLYIWCLNFTTWEKLWEIDVMAEFKCRNIAAPLTVVPHTNLLFAVVDTAAFYVDARNGKIVGEPRRTGYSYAAPVCSEKQAGCFVLFNEGTPYLNLVHLDTKGNTVNNMVLPNNYKINLASGDSLDNIWIVGPTRDQKTVHMKFQVQRRLKAISISLAP